MSSFIQPWGKERGSTFHCISFTVLCSFLLESVQAAQCRLSSASRALFELQQPGALHGFQGRVCVLAPPWCCTVVRTGCTVLPRCFCVQGRQQICAVHEGYVCCAVLVCLCKLSGGMYARENWVCHWRWHQGRPKWKGAILFYLTSLKYNFIPVFE